jgi:ring-1,2-phenylacetyl-CoA epoxidase subunit PaaD
LVATAVTRDDVLGWLAEVADPEIPVLSITDLGIVRDVRIGDKLVVALAPTYSGCPATEVIEQSVIEALHGHGIEDVAIERVLAPPWTTDWISEEGRDKLRAYGIAPPERAASKRQLLHGERSIACPRCGSQDTELVSEFGSTACKSSCKCRDCLEPFEYFKCI